MGNIRLADVAKVAGVSMKTVSNVVHDYPHVSPGMRQRVQRVIDELGYRPNAMGRRLATGKTNLLTLAFADISIPYFSELARVVSIAAHRRGYRLMLEQTDGTLMGERAVFSASEAGLVDGILFQPSVMSATEIATLRSDLPLVLLGEASAPLGVDHVMIDNIAAASDATQHLAALGRTRIGFVGHEAVQQTETSRQRLIGYQDGLEKAGLRLDISLLLPSQRVSADAAAQVVRAALDNGLRFDALVCRDDLAAIGTLRALRERGVAVPEDVAITGWDDISFASFTYPSLTTVAADTTSLTDHALDMLEGRIAGFDGLGRHTLVDYRLILRESAPNTT